MHFASIVGSHGRNGADSRRVPDSYYWIVVRYAVWCQWHKISGGCGYLDERV